MMTGTFTVSGRATYDFVPTSYNASTDTGTLNFAGTQARPIRLAQIRVLEGTTVRATGTTALDGTYSLTFTSTGSGALTVQVLARTTTPPIQVEDNTANDAVWAYAQPVPAGGGTLNVHAASGWNGTRYTSRAAAPFAVLDSMTTASLAILASRPSIVFPMLKVNWSPNNTTATNGTVAQGFLGGSYFEGDDNEIYVVGKDQVDTDEYDNHVIVHEWGHFFEANVSRSDSLGGDHTTGDELDPRDAFSEGWGNAASAMLLNDPLYVDTYWTGSSIRAFGWDLETAPTPTDDPSPGSFSESSTMRFLYDAWDTTNEGAFDGLSGLGPMIDAFVALKTTDALATVGSFVAAYKAQSGVNATSVNTLLAHYSMGPITTAFGDGDAQLRAMYTNVTALPFTTQVTLDGAAPYNWAVQNKYFVFTGTGARVTITATSSQDVSITAYRRGDWADWADDTRSGAETINFLTVAGAVYVLNLNGLSENNAPYSASVSITSP